jgi:hypothetical protein
MKTNEAADICDGFTAVRQASGVWVVISGDFRGRGPTFKAALRNCVREIESYQDAHTEAIRNLCRGK